jgi:Ca2+-binding EF-hand superfamily protein
MAAGALLLSAAWAIAQDQSSSGQQGVVSVGDRFRTMDADQNGNLSKMEFLSHDGDTASRSRDFKLFDSDADSRLSLAEFRCIPWAAGLTERDVPALPDPVMVLVDDGMTSLRTAWSGADANQNGILSRQEFETAEIGGRVPGLSETDWNEWDRDRDGALTREECREVLEIACGVRRPQGDPVRLPSGIVVNWMLWKHFEENHDDRISGREFVDRGFGDPDQRPQIFQQLDLNRDQVLSFAEWSDLSQPTVMSGRIHDPIADFLRMDTDFDGFVSPQELLQGTPVWHVDVTRHVFPGFDGDGDGRLSLIEYRMTPLANWVEFWHYPRTDADNDGWLESNEFRWGTRTGASLSGLLDIYFQLYDMNHDGALDLDEFEFNTSRRDPRREFHSRDTDGNGLISRAEFTRRVQLSAAAAGRDFHILDLNGDEELSYEEFRCWPAVVPLELRGSSPDPVVALVAKNLAEIEPHFAQADENRDGVVSRTEFQTSGAVRRLGGFDAIWREWDRDGNGAVSGAERREQLEVSYGVRRPQGELIHLPSGIVVNWMLWKHYDEDHDDRISAREFTERGFGDPAERPQTFQQLDLDNDGLMTFAEWSDLSQPNVMPGRWHDPFADFLRLDADFDSLVSPDELLKGMPDWHRNVTKHIFPGFDTNGDGRLSLREYRLTPLANWVEFWHVARSDQNRDGSLSRSEFFWETNHPESLARLLQDYFDKQDVNRDGRLDRDEFAF